MAARLGAEASAGAAPLLLLLGAGGTEGGGDRGPSPHERMAEVVAFQFALESRNNRQ